MNIVNLPLAQCVRTVYGTAWQTAQNNKELFAPLPNSTINERLGIQNTAVPPDAVYPFTGYIAIGRGGTTYVIGPDGDTIPKQLKHEPTDVSCFKPIPFVLRQTNNDLTPVERQQYALRRTETHNGVNYFAYYLKRIDPTLTTGVKLEVHTLNPDGSIYSVADFIPTQQNLAPTPVIPANNGLNQLSNTRVVCSCKKTIVITAQEKNEIVTACTIIYGDPDYAVIGEVAICSGIDKIITTPQNFSFNEAIVVQPVFFASIYEMLSASPGQITLNYDISASEPLYAL